MKKYFSLFVIVTCCMIGIGFSCVSQKKVAQISDQGKIKYNWTSYFANPADDVKDYTFNILYLDSVVILEYAEVNFHTGGPVENQRPAVLKIKKYVYLDLKNLHCQDYRRLDTAETPIANYKLTPDEILLWNFYKIDNIPIYENQPFNMPDTILGGQKYKRIYFEQNSVSETFKRVLYMTDQYPDSLFHISLLVDRKYSPLKVMRYDDYLNGTLVAMLYYEKLSNKLTDFEKAVFSRWKYNAQHTDLPLLTMDEALKVK